MSRRKDSSKLAVAFGQAVRKLREGQGFTQEAFAHQAGIDRAYYGLMERGGHTPTITTVWKVAEALGITPAKVIAAVEKRMAQQDAPAPKGKDTAVKRARSGSVEPTAWPKKRANRRPKKKTGRRSPGFFDPSGSD